MAGFSPPPPPLFLSPLLSFFLLSSDIEIVFDFSYITKIHPSFQNPGSAFARVFFHSDSTISNATSKLFGSRDCFDD